MSSNRTATRRRGILAISMILTIVATAGGIWGIAQSAVKEQNRMAWNFTHMVSATVILTIDGRPTELGTGGGVIIDGSGIVMTNAHVVDGAAAVTATFADGRQLDGRVIRDDSRDDLALVQLSNASESLMPLTMGDSDHLRLGERVWLVGATRDGGRVRTGTITGLSPLQHAPKLIQTDIAVRMDDAGSALIDTEGHLIGIVSIALAGVQSTASATSINTAKDLLLSVTKVSPH